MQKYTKEWLEELCKTSYSYAQVLCKAGRKQGGGNNTILKSYIMRYGIDTSHFTGQKWRGTQAYTPRNEFKGKYAVEEVFIKCSPVLQSVLRRYVKRYKLISYKCSICGNDGIWQSQKTSLELDHIDGNATNNELTNLRYLCPNCHALTETYHGRNKAKSNKCVEGIHQLPKSTMIR